MKTRRQFNCLRYVKQQQLWVLHNCVMQSMSEKALKCKAPIQAFNPFYNIALWLPVCTSGAPTENPCWPWRRLTLDLVSLSFLQTYSNQYMLIFRIQASRPWRLTTRIHMRSSEFYSTLHFWLSHSSVPPHHIIMCMRKFRRHTADTPEMWGKYTEPIFIHVIFLTKTALGSMQLLLSCS